MIISETVAVHQCLSPTSYNRTLSGILLKSIQGTSRLSLKMGRADEQKTMMKCKLIKKSSLPLVKVMIFQKLL